MPDYLNEKLKSGVLPLAIYTDLMRVALLEHYGGTWMDATILLTDEIPQEILNSDFFVFHNSLGEIDNPVMFYLPTGNEIIMYQNICFQIL